MAEVDLAEEWRRLQELYRGMSEGELEAVASEGYDLTDIAKQALNGEITRRNLEIVVRLEPPEPEVSEIGDPDFDPATLDLVSAFGVQTREQAAWVKQALNNAGMPCYFGDNLAEEVEGLQFVDELPVDVKVLRNDQQRAFYVLRTFSEQFPQKGLNQEELSEAPVRCPACRSTEVVFEGFNSDEPKLGQASHEGRDLDENGDVEEPEDVEQMRADDPNAKFRWSCDACGHKWQDDGMGSPTG